MQDPSNDIPIVNMQLEEQKKILKRVLERGADIQEESVHIPGNHLRRMTG